MKYYTLSEIFFKEEGLLPRTIEGNHGDGTTTLQLNLKDIKT